jgi:hypothetical protein
MGTSMKIRRIVVRLDPAPRSRTLLQAAAVLAGKMEIELVGLYVENMDLLHFAALPFAREVGVYSAKVRRLDVAAMERSLGAHAKQARSCSPSPLGIFLFDGRFVWRAQANRMPVLQRAISSSRSWDMWRR